ncbi:ATP-dependent RNA helicase CshB [Salsuginibacillus halophilus]|uniref:ATP-dependent RNA helicase CshB n=1 Tax=Salsuginibacillus halophilus TaxID=517424 RepID=A0A2P8HFN6_9BACI|nr:DEAD/DEAH box helicase [Salsuginibacillus halophilus]PSL45004.1 ATP-dependent RNA helicase CshB [Salsuginibacillus halophilus]
MTKAFQQMGINQGLIQVLENRRITKPTDIQQRLLPAGLKGTDVIGQSQTGTGKTLAYLLPIVQNVQPESAHVHAVITAPTRELAFQIHDELLALLAYEPNTSIRTKKAIGGTDREQNVESLKNPPHIVVATPGRLHDMVVKQNVLDVHRAATFVIDEADQMLDMGFIELTDQVAARMPENVQTMVFSATIPEKLKPFLRKYMNQPRHAHVKPEEAAPARIHHYLIPVKNRTRVEMAVSAAKAVRPYLALLFANTKEEADELFDAMIAEGFNVDLLHGGVAPRQRKQVFRRLNDASVQFVVCTDLAARGMDIDGVSHIINTGLPSDLEYYIHRSGRTGRAGADGEVFTIVDKKEETLIEKLASRGIRFGYRDVKRGEWEVLEHLGSGSRPGQAKRKQPKQPTKAKEAGPPPKKPKQVKPGYKKKQQGRRGKR